MAVEARHHNIFPTQLLANREIMNPIEANSNIYNTQIRYGLPLSGTTNATETFLPAAAVYGSVISDSIPQKPVIKSDSTLTYNNVNNNNNNNNNNNHNNNNNNNNNNNIPPPSRKRSRDSINPLLLPYPLIQQSHKSCTSFSFLGQDISLQIQEQQLDVDRLVSQHMEKVRLEIEERRKRQARRVMETIEEGVMKRLKAKEEEIEKIGKLNWALEERVKSLCLENKIWRDLAQTNEATANALRTNLEEVLAQSKHNHNNNNNIPHTQQQQHQHQQKGQQQGLDDEVIDDAQSCCGSSWREEKENKEEAEFEKKLAIQGHFGNSNNIRGLCEIRLCRNCRKEEACVLLLPCRHLSLCRGCGSNLHTCPVCKSAKTVSVHVNMS